MQIGVPREIKPQEYRVGMTPGGVRELVAAGHTVQVQTQCGARIGLTDDLYRDAGAQVIETAEALFADCELIVKVKEPQAQECHLLRSGQTLFTYLHLAADPEQAQLLMASGANCIAYETDYIAQRWLTAARPHERSGRTAVGAGGGAPHGDPSRGQRDVTGGGARCALRASAESSGAGLSAPMQSAWHSAWAQMSRCLTDRSNGSLNWMSNTAGDCAPSIPPQRPSSRPPAMPTSSLARSSLQARRRRS